MHNYLGLDEHHGFRQFSVRRWSVYLSVGLCVSENLGYLKRRFAFQMNPEDHVLASAQLWTTRLNIERPPVSRRLGGDGRPLGVCVCASYSAVSRPRSLSASLHAADPARTGSAPQLRQDHKLRRLPKALTADTYPRIPKLAVSALKTLSKVHRQRLI